MTGADGERELARCLVRAAYYRARAALGHGLARITLEPAILPRFAAARQSVSAPSRRWCHRDALPEMHCLADIGLLATAMKR